MIQPMIFDFNPSFGKSFGQIPSTKIFFISMHFLVTSSLFFCYTIFMLPITIGKRIIDKEDLLIIQAVVNEHWDKGRTHISRVLCKKWNWVQPNGRLKDMACREVLLTLSRKGLIALPPGKYIPNNQKHNRNVPIVQIDNSPICKNISDIKTLKLKMVRHTDLEPLFIRKIDRLIKSPRFWVSFTSSAEESHLIRLSFRQCILFFYVHG